uniref:14-3-3 domain-containing protein n=1 Tax=Mucochytrium quahogii TaxID=96639 RepID=A0A7S2SKW9_9STRA|mmetsp:Transcript_7517/g.16360  ORF Transcript_7517/g.16360 Transcript_7517/m.16360 type:complete len:246 (+) Transcript_7517:321-1058(+)
MILQHFDGSNSCHRLKEFVNPQRAALRTLTLLFVNNTNTRSPDNHQEVTLEYTKCKIDSLVNTCLHIISVVKDTFLPLADCAESRVFFNKLAGDHSRYLCEIPTLKGYKYVPFEKERARAIADTEAFYQVAFDESQCDLSPTHPLRLSLVLNFSIFYFEIRKDKDKAHAFAKSAYDDAMAELGADFSSLLQDPSGGEQSNEASHSGNDGEGGLGASQVLSSGGSQELETARVMRIIKSSLSRWAV